MEKNCWTWTMKTGTILAARSRAVRSANTLLSFLSLPSTTQKLVQYKTANVFTALKMQHPPIIKLIRSPTMSGVRFIPHFSAPEDVAIPSLDQSSDNFESEYTSAVQSLEIGSPLLHLLKIAYASWVWHEVVQWRGTMVLMMTTVEKVYTNQRRGKVWSHFVSTGYEPGSLSAHQHVREGLLVG